MSFANQKLIILETVDSTNNYAMTMVQNDEVNSGDAVFAIQQTAGKGRRNKSWKSNSGENIICSIMHEMQWQPIHKQFEVSMAAALGCWDFFSKYVSKNIKIKWPNDIFINDRKAGGILIENVLKGNLWQWAVIGIGLNINQQNFDEENFKAISLKKITGKNYNVIELAKELHFCVLERIEKLKSGSADDFFYEYNKNLFCLNKNVQLKKENVIFETKIKGVSKAGELITNDNIERRFQFDEIEWICV